MHNSYNSFDSKAITTKSGQSTDHDAKENKLAKNLEKLKLGVSRSCHSGAQQPKPVVLSFEK